MECNPLSYLSSAGSVEVTPSLADTWAISSSKGCRRWEIVDVGLAWKKGSPHLPACFLGLKPVFYGRAMWKDGVSILRSR